MSKPKKPGRPVKGSLRWYENEWMRAFLHPPKSGETPAIYKALAQLSYENAQNRKRIDVLEGLLFTMTTGMVLDRSGNQHLLGCSIREGAKGVCDCGSVPLHDPDKEHC
jgi:hypothetical protein